MNSYKGLKEDFNQIVNLKIPSKTFYSIEMEGKNEKSCSKKWNARRGRQIPWAIQILSSWLPVGKTQQPLQTSIFEVMTPSKTI